MKAGTLLRTMIALLLCGAPAISGFAIAQDSGLDPDIEARKLIHECRDNEGGCVRCHGPDAMGSEKNASLTGNDIRGHTAEETRIAIMALPMMWNVKISDEELLLVEAYLRHLLESAD